MGVSVPSWLRILLVGGSIAAFGSFANADGLRVGRGAVDITPEVGTPMLTPQTPPFEIKLAREAHDPLHVKAVVLESGGRKAAIVTCDLTSVPLAIHQAARRAIGEATGVEPMWAMISATHNHTAPQIRAQYVGKADEAAQAKTAAYIEALPGKIAEAVRLAEADLQPARAFAALGEEGSVSFNRRYFLRDGTVAANPFKGEDERLGEVLRPAGPIDPQVGVVSFAGADDVPLAMLINFAIHLDTMGGDQPSADFPFKIDEVVRAALGEAVQPMFCSGASGNINHYFLMDPARVHRVKGEQESSRIGAILAAEALRALGDRELLRDAPLRMAREQVRLEYKDDKEPAMLARMAGSPRYFDGEVDVTNENGRLSFEAEVQVITLGNELAWVGLPGEMFTELGMNLKNASPFRYTMIHTLANGAIGYVPNMRSYPEKAREDLATRCASGSGERLIGAATRLLIECKNGEPGAGTRTAAVLEEN